MFSCVHIAQKLLSPWGQESYTVMYCKYKQTHRVKLTHPSEEEDLVVTVGDKVADVLRVKLDVVLHAKRGLQVSRADGRFPINRPIPDGKDLHITIAVSTPVLGKS